MGRNAGLGKRAGGLLFALGLQAVLVALLLFSIPQRIAPPAPEQMLLLLSPPRVQPPPQVIDARGRPLRAPLPALPAPPAPPTPPALAPPAQIAPPTQALEDPRCAPDRLGSLPPEDRARCRPVDKAGADKPGLPSTPYQAQKQKQWDADMARKNNEGPSVAPRIGITDPLCKLAVALLGSGGCGPPPAAARVSTDAQFKAALEAAARRHGVNPPSALASPGKNGDVDAQNPDPAAGAVGAATGPGR